MPQSYILFVFVTHVAYKSERRQQLQCPTESKVDNTRSEWLDLFQGQRQDRYSAVSSYETLLALSIPR